MNPRSAYASLSFFSAGSSRRPAGTYSTAGTYWAERVSFHTSNARIVEATDQERRILVEDLVEQVAMLPDHLEVQIAGAPRLNVLLSEVGLKEPVSPSGVGGGI